VANDKWLVNIVTSAEDIDVMQPLADLIVKTYPEVGTVVNNITSKKSGVAIGEIERHLAGDQCLKERLGPYEFEISANSFFQTNTRGAVVLYDTVKKYAELSGAEEILDLYSGTGTIPIWLSDNAKKITGIEIVESAVKDAGENCLKNNVSNCNFIAGDIRTVIPSMTHRPDLVIIDPPRSGMHKDVVATLLNMACENIVYVSCNPSTMARDVQLMKEAYEIVEVQPVDMFPHTYHIESVAKLKKIAPA